MRLLAQRRAALGKVMNVREPKTVALYARVSTTDQNCELQLGDLRRFASQRVALMSMSTLASVGHSATGPDEMHS